MQTYRTAESVYAVIDSETGELFGYLTQADFENDKIIFGINRLGHTIVAL